MKSFLFGTVLGVSVGTVGFTGMAPMMDDGVRFIQTQTINAVQNRELNKPQPQQSQNQLPGDLQQTESTY